MTVDNRTANFDWKKPHPTNLVRTVDLPRMNETFDAIDAKAKAADDFAATRAAADRVDVIESLDVAVDHSLAKPGIPSAKLRRLIEGAEVDASDGFGIDYNGLAVSSSRLADAIEAGNGRTVVVGEGKILLDAKMAIDVNTFAQVSPDANFKPAPRVRGVGAKLTEFRTAVANDYALSLGNGGAVSTYGVGGYIGDFSIRKSDDGIPGQNGIEFSGLYQSLIMPIDIEGLSGTGVRFGSAGVGDYDTSAWSSILNMRVRSCDVGVMVRPSTVGAVPLSYARFIGLVSEYCRINLELTGADMVYLADGSLVNAKAYNIHVRHDGGGHTRNIYMDRVELGNNPAGNSAIVYIEGLINGRFNEGRLIRNNADACASQICFKLGDGVPGHILRNVKFEQNTFIAGDDGRPYYAFDTSGLTPESSKIRVISPDWFEFGAGHTKYYPNASQISYLLDDDDYEDPRALKADATAKDTALDATLRGVITAGDAPDPVYSITVAATGTIFPDITYSAFRLLVNTPSAVVVGPGAGAAPVDGQEYDLVIRNISAGTIVVSFDAVWKQGGFTPPSANKTVSARFRYSAADVAWLQIGAWSPEV